MMRVDFDSFRRCEDAFSRGLSPPPIITLREWVRIYLRAVATLACVPFTLRFATRSVCLVVPPFQWPVKNAGPRVQIAGPRVQIAGLRAGPRRKAAGLRRKVAGLRRKVVGPRFKMRTDPLRICDEAFFRGLRPPPSILVSEWADRHRILPPTSAEPGPWRTARTPYLREIMDRLSPQDPCETVVVMKGAQLGMTSVAENWMGHAIHHDPSPALIVQPTWNTARDYARDRINPLVTATSELRELVGDQVSRRAGTTTTRKQFPGGFLVVTGANSAAELRAKAIRRLVLDEVDGYPADVDGEGDPVSLARKRTATFANRKVLLFSTPTVRGASRIEAEFSGTEDEQRKGYSPTDQRMYFIPCPGCGIFQTLTWDNIRWTELGRLPQDAAYVCPHCHRIIEQHEKDILLARGEWRPTAEGSDSKVAGYSISGLYRPHGWRSWGDIAVDWVKAKRTQDTALLRVIINTDFGETWEITDGKSIDSGILLGRVEDYGHVCPVEVVAITAGVDVQADRLEVEFVGWGVDEESWSLDYLVIRGDPGHGDVWAVLDEQLGRSFVSPNAADGLRVDAACVDAGYQPEWGCEFTKARRLRRIWAVKGMANGERSPRPIWNVRPRRPLRGKYDVYPVGVDTAKELLYARLAVAEPGPGYCHFSAPHNDATYFAQLTAERLRTRYQNGRAIFFWWKPDNRRNEALDCRVYAMAALKSLLAMGHNLEMRRSSMSSARPASPAPVSAPVPSPSRNGPVRWPRIDWGRAGRR